MDRFSRSDFNDGKRIGVDTRGHAPSRKIERIMERGGREEDRESPAFRSQPKSFLATVQIDLRHRLPLSDQVVIDPAETVIGSATRRGRHHPSLIGRSQYQGRLTGLAQDNRVGMLLQECQIVAKVFDHGVTTTSKGTFCP